MFISLGIKFCFVNRTIRKAPQGETNPRVWSMFKRLPLAQARWLVNVCGEPSS